MSTIFITGGTGYIGRRLIPILLKKGYLVKALVRKGSEHRLPVGCSPVYGDALDAKTYQHELSGGEIFIHLVGVAHPGPLKKNSLSR